MKNKTWFYYGDGLDTFGKEDTLALTEIPTPASNEILARVDAVAICASDIKMINLGNEYPLFKGRDFKKHPAVLGHEVSLTIEQVGKELVDEWSVGMRIGVQPDVYMNKIRYCIGVNVHGGMQKYMILHKSVFHSDYGITIFPVNDTLSYASVAQLEPNACVEASYRDWTRSKFDKEKTLLVYIENIGDSTYVLDQDLHHKRVLVIDKTPGFRLPLEVYEKIASLDQISKSSVEDVLIIGNPTSETLTTLIDILAHDALFCWLPNRNPSKNVLVDVAKVHYSCIHWIGTMTRKLSDAFHQVRRTNYYPKGNLLIMGGAGAMGRMHVLRAIVAKDGPKTITVTARGASRLNILLKDFSELAKQNGKSLVVVAMNDEINWRLKLRDICTEKGFDDVVVSAPGVDPVNAATPFLAKNGMIVLFSGTSYGNYVELPIGNIVMNNLQINSSSGSTIEDEKLVHNKLMDKTLDLDKNVVGIAGLYAVKKAITAVENGEFAGKVIIYPQLEHLPLLTIEDAYLFSEELHNHLMSYGWGKKAERIMYEEYKKKEPSNG